MVTSSAPATSIAFVLSDEEMGPELSIVKPETSCAYIAFPPEVVSTVPPEDTLIVASSAAAASVALTFIA